MSNSFLSKITARLGIPMSPSSTPKAAGNALEGLPGKHVFNAEGFARSSDIPADHPDKAALIRATHATLPVEIQPGVHAYPMSWKEADIRAHWAKVEAQKDDPAYDFSHMERDQAPAPKRSATTTSRLTLPPTAPRPTPGKGGVIDLSNGGYFFRDFQDRSVRGTSFISHENNTFMDVNAVRGVGNTSPNFVVTDSKGQEVYRGQGVEVAAGRFIFTADGQLPEGLNPRYFHALKTGESYSVSVAVTPQDGHPNASDDWFRFSVSANKPPKGWEAKTPNQRTQPPAGAPPKVPNSGVQDFSDGGSWSRDFPDKGVSGTSFVSHTPGTTMNASVVVGTATENPTLIIRDSRGTEVHRQRGVEVANARFIFTPDGTLPPDRNARQYIPLKTGEVYSFTGTVDGDAANKNVMRQHLKAYPPR